MGSKSQTFQFKQFSVCHAGCAMKVGTDGILLGLLSPACGNRILDIGTGSGLVALLLAQRNNKAHITGIDIDCGAVRQAADNFRASPWSSRLQSLQADATIYADSQPFDLIVSNPPYYENSPDAANSSRDAARRTENLTHSQLIAAAVSLLAPDGFFSVILPTSISDDFVHECWQSGLHLSSRHLIRTKVGKPCKRNVLTFSQHKTLPITHELTLADADNRRSKEYSALIEDYFIR